MMSTDDKYAEEMKMFLCKKPESYKRMYKYCDEVSKLSLRLMNTYIRKKDWKLLKRQNDGSKTYYRTSPGSSFNVFKGEKLIKVTNPNITPLDLINVISRTVLRFEKDKDFQKRVDPQNCYHRLIHQIPDSNLAIFHGRYSSGYFFVKDRDAVYVRYIIYDEENEQAYLLTKSLMKEDYVKKLLPFDQECVRGEVILYGWVIKKESDQYYRAMLLFHGNLGGFIPAWLYNQTMHKQVDSISNLCKWIESKDFIRDTNIRILSQKKKERN